MLGNEILLKKPDKCDFALIEVSLSYSTINRIAKGLSYLLCQIQDPLQDQELPEPSSFGYGCL